MKVGSCCPLRLQNIKLYAAIKFTMIFFYQMSLLVLKMRGIVMSKDNYLAGKLDPVHMILQVECLIVDMVMVLFPPPQF